MIGVLLFCVAPPATNAQEPPSESPPDQKSSPARRHYWQSLPEPPAFFGVSYLWQNADDPLRGVALSSGIVGEKPYKRGLIHRQEVDSWISWKSNDEQAVWSLGLGGEYPGAVAWGPVRLLPRFALGFEYRTQDPDHGFGVFVGAGPSLDVWISRHMAMSVGVERRFSYPGNDTTQWGFTLRFVGADIPPLIPLA